MGFIPLFYDKPATDHKCTALEAYSSYVILLYLPVKRRQCLIGNGNKLM